MGIALTALSINAPPSAKPHGHGKSKLEVVASARCQEVGIVREFHHPWEPVNHRCARGVVEVRTFPKVEEYRTTSRLEHDECCGLEPHHPSACASPSNEGAYKYTRMGKTSTENNGARAIPVVLQIECRRTHWSSSPSQTFSYFLAEQGGML